MQKQLEIFIDDVPADQMELLIAKLFELGIHGMEELPAGLKAYANLGDFDDAAFDLFSKDRGLVFTINAVKEENWNAIWEANFEPVAIPGKVYVRAAFHPPVGGFEHDILITPKMSFGTGHHATTMMMMKLMLDVNFKEKTVIDFGSGTGILSILAEKLGASKVISIDNESWSVENAVENANLNNCSKVTVTLGSALDDFASAEVVLANINKSILLEHAKSIFEHLHSAGVLILSGLLRADYDDIVQHYSKFLGEPTTMLHEGDWIALVFEKTC